MIEGTQTKEMELLIDKIRMPSGHCQACLSDKSPDKDFMITCTLCQSSIHNKHYGREIDEGAGVVSYDKWKCERCRILLELQAQHKLAEAEKMHCHFCPSLRGILKRVVYNNNETIWLHPQCSTWPYPIIYQKNSRRIHYNSEYPTRATGKFWVDLSEQAAADCQICGKKEGYKIKCMYYRCQKYYHCSCAKSIGFIRDLESMQFENSDTYIPPYCQQHLEQRVLDCSAKAKKYQNLGDEGKASSFSQMMAAYEAQLKNMAKSAEKYRGQEEIRKQMHYQTGNKEELLEELSFGSFEESFSSNHLPDFIDFVFDRDYPLPNPKTGQPSRFIFPKRLGEERRVEKAVQSAEGQIGLAPQEDGAHKIVEFYSSQAKVGEVAESEPEDSEWDCEFEDGRISDE